jgi:hypothetical protein
MGFPLFQDVGYDPTIYTQEVGGSPVLVRDVVSYGERLLRVGLVRPLNFHASPSSSFRIVYDFETCGKVLGLRLVLAARNRRYNHLLSFQPGVHAVQIEGRQLEIPVAGADVEVIVLEAEVATPPPGSHSRLTLRALEIQAERSGNWRIRAPELERSPVHDIAVAQEVVTVDNPLKVDLGPGAPARVAVYDEVGGLTRDVNIPAGEARTMPVVAPDKPGLYRVEITTPIQTLTTIRAVDSRLRGNDAAAEARPEYRHSREGGNPLPMSELREMTGSPARTEFNFLVLGKVSAHPRVLLTAERLEQLRSQSYSNELLAIVHRRAGELRSSLAYNPRAGESLLLLPTVSVHPGIPQYYALMESYSNAIAFNALDFRLSGDRQALEATRRALLTVSAWPTWTPAWFTAKGLHTYYEVGGFTQKVALGYDLIADELSQEEKSKIAEALWKLSIRPTLDGYFFYDRLPIAASNHEPQSVGGAIEACVALYGDVPDWSAKFGPALAELIVAYEGLLDGLFPGDGSEAEPAGYDDFAMEGMSWGMAALHALGIRPRGFEKMMQAFWWLRYARVRPDLVLDSGDTGPELRGLSGYAWGAEFVGDPALRAFYDTATDSSLMSVFGLPAAGGLQPVARARGEPPGFLDLVCCTHPAVTPPEAPPSRVFPGRGSAVLRSGWNPLDTVISIRVGPWFNHEHHDQGSFRIAAYGEEIVAEAGYAEYYRDPHYPDFFTQAPAHNTVIIDDDPFSQKDYDGRYWPQFQDFAKFERHVLSPGIDYLSADLAPAYGDGGQVDRLTREYLFVKPTILIVHDRVEAASPHGYSWLLHVPPGAQASIDAAQALVHGKAAVAALTAAGENTHWTLAQQPVPTHAYGDFDRVPVEPRETFRLDTPREKEGSFLVALRFQKAGEEPAPLQPFSTISGQGFQATGGTMQVLFRSKPGPLTTGRLMADGDVLAIQDGNGVKEVFGGNLKVLQRGTQVVFSSIPASDVAMRESSQAADPSLLSGEALRETSALHNAVEVHVFCTATTDLKIYAEKPPKEVRLDQGLVSAPQAAGFISFARLSKGEHAISITY